MGKPKGQDWESWIEQLIREARERGDFDNLPGKGKPLDLTPNPYAQDQEMAFKILKDSGCAPEWIELDKAIRGRLDKARRALARAREVYEQRLGELGQPAGLAEAKNERAVEGWRRAVAVFEEEVAALNKEIASLNLKVPSSRFQRPRIDAGREVAAVEGRGG